MKTEVRGTQIELEPNSRPYLLKRILADSVDIVLIFGLYLLLTFLILQTPLADSYHAHAGRALEIVSEKTAQFPDDPAAVGASLNADAEYRDEVFTANLYGYLLKGLAVFLAEALFLLVIPLANRDRMTVGKRLTGIMPFNEKRQSRAAWFQLLYRFLFVFIIDSMVLYLFTGTLSFLAVPVLRLAEMLTIRKNKTICDAVTGIMIIEKVSYDGIN